jgi:uncharacterized membrane protein
MKKERNNIFVQMHPLTRLIISLIVAILPFFLLNNGEISLLLRLMVSWIVFTFTFLICSWIVIIQRTVPQIRKKAKKDDGSVAFVFFMVLISSFAGMLDVLLIIISKDYAIHGSPLFLPSCISGMILSWIMVHTIYVFHYAHEYYDSKDKNGNKYVGGLVFPEENEPDYLDFAYYSFCMGCTFQVSDINITSRKIRRITMFHSLLSFVLNTFVVALTVNLIAGLTG